MASEGEFPKIDGDVLFASEVNRFNNGIYNDLVYVPTDIMGILAHSSTNWTAINGGSTKITSDSGVTWTLANADSSDMSGVTKVCDADKTKAICFKNTAPDCNITSDSGDNWAGASTDPADGGSGGEIHDLSFPTATVAVCCGENLTTRGIYYSTDAGDNWTVCSTGPSGKTEALSMLDGTNGFAIDDAGNIWTTGDGGINWTDSGVNTGSSDPASSIVPLTSTTGIYLNTEVANDTIETFDTTDSSTVRLALKSDTSYTYGSNLLKTTNGNIYFAQYSFTPEHGSNLTLYRSTDSGVTWQNRSIGDCLFNTISDLTNPDSKAQLVEYDTNKLLLMAGTITLMKLDETGG